MSGLSVVELSPKHCCGVGPRAKTQSGRSRLPSSTVGAPQATASGRSVVSRSLRQKSRIRPGKFPILLLEHPLAGARLENRKVSLAPPRNIKAERRKGATDNSFRNDNTPAGCTMRPVSSISQKLSPLYRGTFLFGTACGISIALTPLLLDERGYSKEDIGTLALFFALGLVLFAVPVGGILRRFGSKPTLTVSLIGYAAAVTAFPFVDTYLGIAIVRFFDGVFSIGVWVSSETILLARADKKHKGHLTSLYAIWLASGYVVGPVLSTGLARLLSNHQMLILAGLTALASALYIAQTLSKDQQPRNEDLLENSSPNEATLDEPVDSAELQTPGRMSPGAVLLRIKTSCFAALSYGYFQASVVLFLPLYLIEQKWVARENTIVIPGLFCLGMLLFSNTAGRPGDRYGHLKVVTILSALGTLSVISFVHVDHYPLMCALVVFAGATFASMSPVALALVGVVIPAAELSRANAIYNTFYAGGMLVGPLASSLIFARFGGPSMLYHLATLWTLMVVFCVVFSQDDPASRKPRPTRARRAPA